jgi:Ca2+ transporting ATPase
VENISVDELLVGDIQIIETGEIISVDGFLLEGHNLIADESSMTGEPLGIKKAVPTWAPGESINPFLISSSKILEGTGKMIVLAIGEHSQYGILKKKIQSSDDETPLQIKLSVLADQIGQVGMYAALLTFLCMLGHIIYGSYASGTFIATLFSLPTLHHLVEAFIVAVSIIVVAVPEGLPLAVTIALAYSVGKMKDENNLVRFLQACETMGGADNICSDKTGTLTKNKMTVTKMFVQERTVDNIAKGFMNDSIGEIFSVGVSLNSSANPILVEKNGILEIDQIGNKTDCALLEVAHILGHDYRNIRKENEENIVKVVPFSSETKTMSSVVNYKGKLHIFSKGAPDYLLKNCAFYLDAKGDAVPITDTFKSTLNGKLKEFADATLRTLLIAFRYGKNENCNTEN